MAAWNFAPPRTLTLTIDFEKLVHDMLGTQAEYFPKLARPFDRGHRQTAKDDI